MQDSQQHQSSNAESHGGINDFLPVVQKALLLHLNQNQQDSALGQGPIGPGQDKGKEVDICLVKLSPQF